jgi:hypothetical protein
MGTSRQLAAGTEHLNMHLMILRMNFSSQAPVPVPCCCSVIFETRAKALPYLIK